jgi:hypothetical protein
MDHQALLKQFDHLNHMNPDKFESTDLDMLIEAVTRTPVLSLLCLWGCKCDK